MRNSYFVKNRRSHYENDSYNQSKGVDRKYYIFKECEKGMIDGILLLRVNF